MRKLLLAVLASFALPQAGRGGLLIDLRATSVSGPAAIVDPHHVQVTGAGAQIQMDIWAQIQGANGNPFDDGLISASGSLLSTLDRNAPYYERIFGALSATRDPRFMGLGGSNGMQTDLDGDGDLDVGSNNPAAAEGFFAVRANEAPHPAQGSEIRIGQATFNVQAVTSATGVTRLFFEPRNSLVAALWYEDGLLIRANETSGNYLGGYGVAVSAVPEPAALSMLALAATFASALRPRKREEK